LKSHINKKFQASATYHQVYYLENLAKINKYGIASEDAKNLMKLIINEFDMGICDYFYKVNHKNKLVGLIYISKTMKEIFTKFHDVLIIDSTLGKNRFNIPVVNFIAIDNNGSSWIIAFGLIEDETEESYHWLFVGFLEIMECSPEIIYIDEQQSIINGKLNLIMNYL